MSKTENQKFRSVMRVAMRTIFVVVLLLLAVGVNGGLYKRGNHCYPYSDCEKHMDKQIKELQVEVRTLVHREEQMDKQIKELQVRTLKDNVTYREKLCPCGSS